MKPWVFSTLEPGPSKLTRTFFEIFNKTNATENDRDRNVYLSKNFD